jgi:hypothetical protein
MSEHRVSGKNTCVCGYLATGSSGRQRGRALNAHLTEAWADQRRIHRVATGKKGPIPTDLENDRAGREEKRLAISQQGLLT